MRRYPRYGVAGLLVLAAMQAALVASALHVAPVELWQAVSGWATPVCWWGYILALDAWLWQRRGQSLCTTRRPLLALQCILSVAFWCLFEAYNRLIPGWRYINLDPDLSVRFLGYTIAFATIMPGMFVTCEAVQSLGWLSRVRVKPIQWSASGLRLLVALGAVCCVLPAFMPANTRGYLWAFVWVGFVLLLEPFNYRRGVPALFRDWERGDWSRTAQLCLAGAVCGLLWEFWNMWAFTKWEYIFPFPWVRELKYFEMPLVGFFGFPPFALEYFVMFHFLAGFYTREDKLGL